MTQQTDLTALVELGRWIGKKGWCPATGGNLSARINSELCWVSESGKDKGSLESTDFIEVDIASGQSLSQRKPSAETRLHTALYQLFPSASVVLHTHSVNATVLSRIHKEKFLQIEGYEMQKTLKGQVTHQAFVNIPIFANNQDISVLAGQVLQHYLQPETSNTYGFLVRGHGLYCWGDNIGDAKRHLEGLEFLFECDLKQRLLEVR